MTIIQKGGKMSTKLVRYKDVCNAVIPMIADMLQKGNVKPAINTLKALGALEDVDLAKVLKEYCKTHSYDCKGCKYLDIEGHDGCIFTCAEAPGEWEI